MQHMFFAIGEHALTLCDYELFVILFPLLSQCLTVDSRVAAGAPPRTDQAAVDVHSEL